MLKSLIHSIEILAYEELPFQEHDKTAEYEDCLRSHLDLVKKNANCAFSEISSDIQT